MLRGNTQKRFTARSPKDYVIWGMMIMAQEKNLPMSTVIGVLERINPSKKGIGYYRSAQRITKERMEARRECSDPMSMYIEQIANKSVFVGLTVMGREVNASFQEMADVFYRRTGADDVTRECLCVWANQDARVFSS